MEYPTTEQIADALDVAGDYLERHGWCRGKLFEQERSCARGAIIRATRVRPSTYLAGQGPFAQNVLTNLAEDALVEYLTTSGVRVQESTLIDQLPYWNDHLAKDADEVIAAFRKTALTVREQVDG